MAGKDCVAIASDRRLGVQLVCRSPFFLPTRESMSILYGRIMQLTNNDQ